MCQLWPRKRKDSKEFFCLLKETGVRKATFSINGVTAQVLCAQGQISFVEIDPENRKVRTRKLSNKLRKDKGTLHS